MPSTRCGRTSTARSVGSARSRVGSGFGFAKACSRIDGPVSTKRGAESCGRAAITRRAAVATAADAVGRINPKRAETARCGAEPSMSRITLRFLRSGEGADRLVVASVRPDIDLGRWESVGPENGPDVGAMIAPMMGELGHQDPSRDHELAPLVANDAVRI